MKLDLIYEKKYFDRSQIKEYVNQDDIRDWRVKKHCDCQTSSGGSCLLVDGCCCMVSFQILSVMLTSIYDWKDGWRGEREEERDETKNKKGESANFGYGSFTNALHCYAAAILPKNTQIVPFLFLYWGYICSLCKYVNDLYLYA